MTTITAQIRRDADGSTESVDMEVTRAGGQYQLHPAVPFSLGERDVLLLDDGAVEEITSTWGEA